MRKVPSRLPLSISSACVRLILPTYHVRSSWWGRSSSSSIREYWLWRGQGGTLVTYPPASEAPLLPGQCSFPGELLLILQNPPKMAHLLGSPPSPLHVVTHSSVSFLIPNHSLIFFCRAPFWVSHLGGREKVVHAAEAGPAHRGEVQPGWRRSLTSKGGFGYASASCHTGPALAWPRAA